MTLGSRIEARRKEIGISQAELARRVGIRQSTMNSLINGDSRTTRSLDKIASELRTTPAYLRGETDDADEAAAGFAPLTRDQGEMLAYLDALDQRSRTALLHVARTMAHGRPDAAPTLHAPKLEYRGG